MEVYAGGISLHIIERVKFLPLLHFHIIVVYEYFGVKITHMIKTRCYQIYFI